MTTKTPETIEALITSLARTPTKIARIIEGLSQDAAKLKPSPEQFSIIENICHLRDIELDGYSVRIQRILKEKVPYLADIDGARLAIVRDYTRQKLADALDAFTKARNDNVAVISEVNDEQLKRTGMLQGNGEVTLEGLLRLMWEHDKAHVEDLQRLADGNESSCNRLP